MSVNITFTGDIYDYTATQFSGTEVRYQVYFVKINTGSSPSAWGSSLNSILGQYNFNLADIVGTTGSVNDGDYVVVVFWVPNTVERNNLGLTQWSMFEIVLGTGPGMISSDVYTNNVQVKQNILPNLDWSLSSTGFVNTDYTATNNSYDEHTWVFNSVTMRHERARYSQNIQLVNTVSGTQYDWDDGHKDVGLSGAANGTHQWSSADFYDVEIVIADECNATVTGTKQIQIFNHAPTCGIKCNQAVGQNITTPDTVVTFEFDGGDIDDKITSIDWHIHDSGSYGNTDTVVSGSNKTDVISHSNGLGTDWCGHSTTSGAFTNPGDHLVEATVNWYDGFSTQVLNCEETFTQQKFTGPAINFSQAPPQATVGSGIIFTNTSTDISRVGLGLPDCTEYDWRWTDNGVDVDYLDKPFSYELNVMPTSANCLVRLCADWSDGWDTNTTCTEEDVVFGTIVTITEVECYYNLNIVGTSSDGSVSGYSWGVYRSTSFSIVGPYELMWSSPIGIEQNDKKVCFTEENYFKITGYVYGTGVTTSDDEYLYIDEICVSGTEGETEYVAIPVCQPEMDPDEFGTVAVTVEGSPETPNINDTKLIVGSPNMTATS